MEPKPIVCKNCNAVFTGNYCNHCGEKRYRDHDRSVLHFVEEGVHFITHLDGKLFNTLRLIFTRPGQLSVDYCNGIRKRYFKPLSFFLLLVVIYLLFPMFEGLNMKMSYYFSNRLYGNYAAHKAQELMAARHWTMGQLAEAFAHKSEKTSKFLLLILIPLTAAFFWLVSFRKRRYFFDQMVFASEVNSFYLLWGFLILPLLLGLTGWAAHALTKQYLIIPDLALVAIVYLFLVGYVAIGVRRFYGISAIKAIGIALLFALAHEIFVQGLYKFLLFVIVIKQIH